MKIRSLAQRTYLKRMAAVAVFYLAAVFLASSVVDEGDPVTWLTIVVAILPGLGVVGFFWAMGRLMVEEQDEFIRMLITRQALIATGLALSLASVWGFLETYDVAPHVDAYWWAIAFFFGIGVGAVVNKIQYGTTGECL